MATDAVNDYSLMTVPRIEERLSSRALKRIFQRQTSYGVVLHMLETGVQHVSTQQIAGVGCAWSFRELKTECHP